MSAHRGSSVDILIVVDDEAFGYVAGKVLREAGHCGAVARDHRLALQLLGSALPLDLLITDVVMPGRVNGFTLARMARMRRHGLSVIYMTAYDDLPVDGAMGKLLRKPFPLEMLPLEVAEVLAAKGQ
jgi:CheY-like chemotaxis protein